MNYLPTHIVPFQIYLSRFCNIHLYPLYDSIMIIIIITSVIKLEVSYYSRDDSNKRLSGTGGDLYLIDIEFQNSIAVGIIKRSTRITSLFHCFCYL